jgi:uncharacterized membrane protein YfcA
MFNLSQVLRCGAMTLALSATASLAQAQILYTGPGTNLGTLSTTTPTMFEDPTLPPNGIAFSDSWDFTLPAGAGGGGGGTSGANVFIAFPNVYLDYLSALTVSIPGSTSFSSTVTATGEVFSFTAPAGNYVLDVSGATAAGAAGGFYIGSIVATPVPEPATWALMLAGIAVGAGVARRRLS